MLLTLPKTMSNKIVAVQSTDYSGGNYHRELWVCSGGFQGFIRLRRAFSKSPLLCPHLLPSFKKHHDLLARNRASENSLLMEIIVFLLFFGGFSQDQFRGFKSTIFKGIWRPQRLHDY